MASSVDELRAVIEDLRNWPPDFDNMRLKLAKQFKTNKQKKYAKKFFDYVVETEEILYVDTISGRDIYYVRFECASSMFRIAKSKAGKLLRLRYWRPFGSS